MDLKEIQTILHNEKGKIIIVENGEPTMVILLYEEYKSRQKNAPAVTQSSQDDSPLEETQSGEELTIDDLPL